MPRQSKKHCSNCPHQQCCHNTNSTTSNGNPACHQTNHQFSNKLSQLVYRSAASPVSTANALSTTRGEKTLPF